MSHQPLDVISVLKNIAIRLDLKADAEHVVAEGERVAAAHPGLGKPAWDPLTGVALNLAAEHAAAADLADARALAWRTHATYARRGQVIMPGPAPGEYLEGVARAGRDVRRRAWKMVLGLLPETFKFGLYEKCCMLGHGALLPRSAADAEDDARDSQVALQALRHDQQRVMVMASKNPSHIGKIFHDEAEAYELTGMNANVPPAERVEGPPPQTYDRPPRR